MNVNATYRQTQNTHQRTFLQYLMTVMYESLGISFFDCMSARWGKVTYIWICSYIVKAGPILGGVVVVCIDSMPFLIAMLEDGRE